jgi:DNA-binding MarR family transcriptional regulator
MSETLTGVDIGRAERATRALLDRLLGEASISFEQWVVLRALALGEERTTRAEFEASVAVLLQVDAGVVSDGVADLETAGLVSGDNELALTPAGRSRFDHVQAGVAQTAAALYGDLDPADLSVAHRVLVEVTSRAEALRAR